MHFGSLFRKGCCAGNNEAEALSLPRAARPLQPCTDADPCCSYPAIAPPFIPSKASTTPHATPQLTLDTQQPRTILCIRSSKPWYCPSHIIMATATYPIQVTYCGGTSSSPTLLCPTNTHQYARCPPNTASSAERRKNAKSGSKRSTQTCTTSYTQTARHPAPFLPRLPSNPHRRSP
jgi:hypothetical protein